MSRPTRAASGHRPDRDSLLAPEIAVRIMRPLLLVLRDRFGREFVEEVVTEAGLTVADLERSDGWVANVFANRLGTAIACRLSGETQAPGYEHPVWQLWLEVGHTTVRPELIGAMYTVLRAFGSPAAVMRQFPKRQPSLR